MCRQAMHRAGLLQLAAYANALEEAALEFAAAAAQQELSAQLLQVRSMNDVLTRLHVSSGACCSGSFDMRSNMALPMHEWAAIVL